MAQIQVEHVTLGYEGKPVVEDLCFSVDRGDYLCIIGDNGSGKTTLMKALLGLQSPMSGHIRFDGDFSRGEMGYLPQQTNFQKDFPATVDEIVCSGCQNRMGLRPFYSKADRHLAQANMERMGIADLRKESFANLSGGQRQRVLLARALCATKKALLLDEPVSGLDPNAAGEMYEIVKALNEEGVTILMISHDVSEALDHATHVLSIGSRPFFGTKADYVKEVSE